MSLGRWQPPTGHALSKWILYPAHVQTRNRVAHSTSCHALRRVPIDALRTVRLEQLEPGVRLCCHCLRTEPRQLALDFRAPSSATSAGTASDASSRSSASTNVAHGEEGPR